MCWIIGTAVPDMGNVVVQQLFLELFGTHFNCFFALSIKNVENFKTASTMQVFQKAISPRH